MNHNDGIVSSELGSISVVDYLLAIVLTIVALTLRLLFIEQPVRYDEAVSYYFFYGDSLFQATHNYSSPNNHVLHSVLGTSKNSFFNGWYLVWKGRCIFLYS